MPINEFPNTGSIFGSGGANAPSGVFLYADYGMLGRGLVTGIFIYATGLSNYLSFPNTGSIWGSGGANAPSGVFLYADYGFERGTPYLIKSDDAGSGASPVVVSPFKPYAYFFMLK